MPSSLRKAAVLGLLMTGVVDLVFLNVSLVPALLHASDDDESTLKIAVSADPIDGGTKAEPALETMATDAAVALLVPDSAGEATYKSRLYDAGQPVPVDASPKPITGFTKKSEPASVSKNSAGVEPPRPLSSSG